MIKVAILAAVIGGLGGSLAKACGSSSKVATKNADELVEPAARATRNGDEALAPAAAAAKAEPQEAARADDLADVAVEGAAQAGSAVAEENEE